LLVIGVSAFFGLLLGLLFDFLAAISSELRPFDFYRSIVRKSSGKQGMGIVQVLLQTRDSRTELATSAAENHPLAGLAQDLDRLSGEIRALYKAALPPALIHQITRGAAEQVAIGRLMLDDCAAREAKGTLTTKHVANASAWISGVRKFIEKRQAAHVLNTRRKLCVVKSRQTGQ
jgi:hypothetical protein